MLSPFSPCSLNVQSFLARSTCPIRIYCASAAKVALMTIGWIFCHLFHPDLCWMLRFHPSAVGIRDYTFISHLSSWCALQEFSLYSATGSIPVFTYGTFILFFLHRLRLQCFNDLKLDSSVINLITCHFYWFNVVPTKWLQQTQWSMKIQIIHCFFF